MNKLKFYQLAALLLFLLNVGFVLFGMRHPPQKGNGPAVKMIKELSLDDSQKASFMEMGRKHHEDLLQLNQEQKAVLQKYFQQLPNDYTEVNSSEQLSSICRIEERKIDLTYSHLQDIYKLLNPEQQGLYKPMIEEALTSILMIRKK